MGNSGTGNTAGVEGTHGQLCTRFTNGLCRNNTDGFADIHALTGSQVASVALGANAVHRIALQYRAYLDLFNFGRHDGVGHFFRNNFVATCQQFTRGRMQHILKAGTANNTIL